MIDNSSWARILLFNQERLCPEEQSEWLLNKCVCYESKERLFKYSFMGTGVIK